MQCSRCGSQDSKVMESRDVSEAGAIRRRRMCLDCSHRFTTYERIELPNLVVIKKDGTRELFNRNKILAGLNRAFEKRPVTNMQLEELVSSIEQELRTSGEAEVKSSDLGEKVLKELAPVDEVAYVRFASVYRSFRDIASFEKELLKLKS